MGILTNKESARSFSSYVTSFGLALLISSIFYLKRLNNSIENFPCLQDPVFEATDSLYPSCSQFSSWRVAAIVGIVIGVIDTLIVPFLYCCLCCTACGCALCMYFGWPDDYPQDPVQNTNTTIDTEDTETTAINIEPETPTTPPKSNSKKYDVEKMPSKLQFWLNTFGWTLWVLGPFLATLFINISMYRSDAIRSRNDDLFNPALALFVIALFNLMVYFQKFMDSICSYGHTKVTNSSKG
ncbi:hypothetical protein Bhyg_02568 [Pseudolycoriella hygida]|uniref:Transmembrane protein n=1 Tax=Pseudolycoriella hygida TaxID=35572 RepID=A0A9Q0NCV7_9DIPT|nr:hypothetical protein Bhyg_02568 [Pseudolycoriella hygida]